MRREWLKVLFTDISSWQRRNSDNNDRAASELLAAFSMRINTRQVADQVIWSAVFLW